MQQDAPQYAGLLDPVEVWVSPTSQYKGASPDVLKRMKRPTGKGNLLGLVERMRAGAFNFWADNALRFGLLYSSEEGAMVTLLSDSSVCGLTT